MATTGALQTYLTEKANEYVNLYRDRIVELLLDGETDLLKVLKSDCDFNDHTEDTLIFEVEDLKSLYGVNEEGLGDAEYKKELKTLLTKYRRELFAAIKVDIAEVVKEELESLTKELELLTKDTGYCYDMEDPEEVEDYNEEQEVIDGVAGSIETLNKFLAGVEVK